MNFLSQLRRADASPTGVLLIVCAGVIVASLDLFIVNVALPDLAKDLNEPDLGTLSWVLNAYAIVYASLLVLFGRMADRYPRELGFLVGLAVFVVASAACAAADSIEALVVARVFQAAGAALLTPTSLSLILATAPLEKRQSSVRAWTAIGGLAAALGPVAGGVLAEFSWRWVFIVNVPIGIAALIVGWRMLPRVPGHEIPRPDAFGALLVTAGVGLLSLGLVKGGDWGWSSAETAGALVASVAMLLAFAWHTTHHSNPLISPELFRGRAFTGSSVAMLLFSAAFGAMLLSVVLWSEGVWGWSALQTGLGIAPGPLMVPVFAFGISGRLIEKYGAGRVALGGLLVFALGILSWSVLVTVEPNYLTGVVPGMLLTGAGVGLTLPTLMANAAGSLPPEQFAAGSGVVNMFRQVGLAIGVAALVAVLGTPGTGQAALDAFRTGWVVTGGFALAAAVVAAAVLVQRAPAAAPAPAPGR
ncbi:MAG: MFS transporter [Solirubrobacteraceae bacterium]|nr:MFS transporter [Solirubrobacteraceae bacterium]